MVEILLSVLSSEYLVGPLYLILEKPVLPLFIRHVLFLLVQVPLQASKVLAELFDDIVIFIDLLLVDL